MKKRFSKVTFGVLVGLMLVGGLAGCGEISVEVNDGKSKSESSVEVQDGDATFSDYVVVKKEVEPGQFVICVSDTKGKAGGLSCDWEGYHAEYDTPSDN